RRRHTRFSRDWSSDVCSSDLEKCFAAIQEQSGKIDGLAHCIAFAKTEELAGDFSETSREGYLLAQNISSYSLTVISKYAKPLMRSEERRVGKGGNVREAEVP